MKAGIRSIIVKKNKSRRVVEKSKKKKCFKYSTIGCKVVATFIIIFGKCRRENI
jgi:hypothetical protein